MLHARLTAIDAASLTCSLMAPEPALFTLLSLPGQASTNPSLLQSPSPPLQPCIVPRADSESSLEAIARQSVTSPACSEPLKLTSQRTPCPQIFQRRRAQLSKTHPSAPSPAWARHALDILPQSRPVLCWVQAPEASKAWQGKGKGRACPSTHPWIALQCVDHKRKKKICTLYKAAQAGPRGRNGHPWLHTVAVPKVSLVQCKMGRTCLNNMAL